MKLSALTLATPDSSWEEICETYPAYGYEALDIRGIKRQMNLTKVSEFSDANLSRSLSLLKFKNLKIICLSTSVSFVGKTKEEMDKTFEEGKSHIVLASKMGASFIRVFGGQDSSGKTTVEDAIREVAAGLKFLGDFAKPYGIKILIETHDAFSFSKTLSEVVKQTNHPNVGILWDIANSFYAGASIENSVETLIEHINYTHIKDGDGKTYTLCGEGKVPLEKAIRFLKAKGYDGYYGVEWEKAWQPEILDAKIALPQYAKKLKEYYQLN